MILFIFITSLLIAVLGLLGLGYMIFKKIPDLKNLNVESLIEEKQGKTKADILEAKFLRFSSRLRAKINKTMTPQKGFLAKKIKKIKARVTEIEEQYENSQGQKIEPPTIPELLMEAKKLINEEEFVGAERFLIEIIARDNKNIQAYEKLGDLYFKMRSYEQAEEIYKYLLKLKIVGDSSQHTIRRNKMEELEADTLSQLDVDHKISVYYEELGQVYEVMGKDHKALDAYLKATSIDPNNPKYLDKLLEISLKIKDRDLAKDALNNLRKINPDNAKLPVWQEAIEKL